MFQYFFFSIYEERNLVSSFKTPWSVNFIMPGLLCPFSCSILICLIQKMGKKSTFLQFCKFQFYSTQYLKLMKDIKNVDHYFKISTFRLFCYTYWNDIHKSKFVKPQLMLYIFFNRKLFISSFCMYAQNHLLSKMEMLFEMQFLYVFANRIIFNISNKFEFQLEMQFII